MRNVTSVYCEECVEEIPNDEIYWEEKRLYCGRCGSELDLAQLHGDVFDTIVEGRSERPFHSDDPDDEELDLDEDDEEEEDEDADEDEED